MTMQTVVVYDSKFGNTERIADAIARGVGTLGSVLVMDTAEATGTGQGPAGRPDLMLLGGPTQKRAPSPALRARSTSPSAATASEATSAAARLASAAATARS